MTNPRLSRLAPTAALRQPQPGATPRVTNMELFFDLVYVFTIIQISHYLLEHESWLGALQTAILFAAVWWAWNYTAWATNWLDPNHTAGRLLMIGLMACALLMAVAIPHAYTADAELFVGAYITMSLLRAGYMALLFRGQQMGQNYAQLSAWSALSALAWLAGALYPAGRTWLWLLAVVIDYAAPYAGFWLPRVGSTPMSSWPLAGLHLLERNQQVFIIALGESILLLGGTLIGLELNLPVLVAAAAGFLTIVALWWLYFVYTTEQGEEAFVHKRDHTQLARAGLAYAHGIMVGGAIVVAVAIEQIIAHPTDHVHLPTILFATIGPIIYLVGSMLFHRSVADKLPISNLVALVGLAVMGWVAYTFAVTGVVLGLIVLAVLVGLIVVNTLPAAGEAHITTEA